MLAELRCVTCRWKVALIDKAIDQWLSSIERIIRAREGHVILSVIGTNADLIRLTLYCLAAMLVTVQSEEHFYPQP